MLVELHIENLGVIERVTLTLGAGLTALTGETGAGKTMLVEAIELLVGGRADNAIVRAGAEEARVEGRFVTGDDEIVLSRVIPADGRSRAYVNGRPATASTLADLTSTTVDLHGQHAHQSLLGAAAQRQALDAAGGVDLGPLREAQGEVAAIEAELATLGGDERARVREIDLLRFQLAELGAAGVGAEMDPDEDAALAAEEALLSDAQAHREAAAAVGELIGGEGGASAALHAALGSLRARIPFAVEHERLSALVADLDDLSAGLRQKAEGIDEDPGRLDELRQRRQQLRDLCRKYGDTLADVVDFHAEARARLAELDSHAERVAVLEAERASALTRLAEAAGAVGDRRRSAAPGLAASVQQRLRILAMPNAAVVVAVGEPPDDPAGDGVQFLLSANPGSPPQPLSRVASGGELARAMLALRLVFTDTRVSPGTTTLVFDEVDAGVGGAAALAVGEALADLGARHQVLVVTHLAQVAAFAGTQIVVDKAVSGHSTTATARPVVGDDRVEEVARMLSGSPASESAREHAAELLAR